MIRSIGEKGFQGYISNIDEKEVDLVNSGNKQMFLNNQSKNDICGEDENKNNNDVNNNNSNNNNLNAFYDFIDIESLELIKNQFLSELLGLNEICDKSKQICKSINESNLDMENSS
ncbi:hypothetical protein ACTA71_002355 [Dictyostelium dimigraforme]